MGEHPVLGEKVSAKAQKWNGCVCWDGGPKEAQPHWNGVEKNVWFSKARADRVDLNILRGEVEGSWGRSRGLGVTRMSF